MNFLPTICRWFRSLAQRPAAKREIDEELRFHLEQRTAENIAAGMSPEEAARAARKRFGNIQSVREDCREARTVNFGETILQDVRFGLRLLRKSPAFAAISIITLALGIGANTAVFSVVNASLLQPLPYRNADRIVQVWSRTLNNERLNPSLPDFKDFREQDRSLDKMAFYRLVNFHFTSTPDPQEVRSARVSAEFFDVFGVAPAMGRTFFPEETEPGNDQVVVLGHGLWKRRFGGDTNIIGQTISLEGTSRVVCGIMPPEFAYPEPAELWVPYGPNSEHINTKRDDHFDRCIGRLAPGVGRASAETELEAIAARLERQYPDTNTGVSARLAPLKAELVRAFKPALLLLLGAVAAVLLIACANIANLQLARGLVREKEVAIRSALGAAHGRIVRQFLVESITLSVTGGVVGLLVAPYATHFLLALAPANLPRLQETRLDITVLAACLGLSVATGILSGLIPAFRAAGVQLTEQLKDGGKGSTDSSVRHRFRNALVMGEVAIAVVVLICAGLLLQSLQKLDRMAPGFDARDLATTRITLPWSKYHDNGTDKEFFRTFIERIRQVPGMQDSALACSLPIADHSTIIWFRESGTSTAPGKQPTAAFNYTTPSYFETLKIPLLRGRGLDEHDTGSSRSVVVVDEPLVKRYFAGQDPNGRQIEVEVGGHIGEPFTIVGVVGGVRQRNLTDPPEPQFYFSFQQINEGSMWLVTRGASRLPGFERTVAGVVRKLDADQSIGPVRTLEKYLGESSRLARFRASLLGLLALLAVALAVIGNYSVAAFSVSQRRREWGLRMALGAERRDIFRLILGQNFKWVAAGAALGVVLAWGVTRLLVDMLFEISPTDSLSFLAMPLALMLAALLGSYFPARRAMRTDPIVVLRCE